MIDRSSFSRLEAVRARSVRSASRSVMVGLLFGAVLALSDVVVTGAVSSVSATPPPSVTLRLLGALVTATGYGVVLGTVSLLLGVLGLRGWPAAGFQGAVMTGATLIHVLSLALRVQSGSFLTVGAVEFCLNSFQHVAQAARSDFLGEVVLLAAVAIAIGGASAWIVQRLACSGVMRSPVIASVGTAVVVPAMVWVVPVRATPRHPIWKTTAELAFIASVGRAYGSEDDVDGGQSIEPGPPLSAGAIWRQMVDASSGERPNVIVLILESIRLDGLGYEGYARPTTPNLDRLAAESVRFHRVWATATHSSYSQMAVLSSLFPYRGTTLDMYLKLDYPRMLWHDVLSAAGYETATISSQNEAWQGMNRFQKTGTPTTLFHAPDHEGERLLIGSERIMPDHVTVEHAMRWIDGRGDTRWGLYVNLQSTHFSYKIPPGRSPRFQPTGPLSKNFDYFNYSEADAVRVRNRYDSALAYVDEQVGRLRDFLEERGELNDTLWVITADHGESFHDHGWVTHGRSLFDTEARVPLLLHYPKRLEPRDVEVPVGHLDVLPTVAELVGVGPHPAFQGRSVVDLARGAEPSESRRAIFMNIQGLRSMRGVVCWPYKLVFDDENESEALYDLAADPNEARDLSASEPGVARALSDLLSSFIRAQRRYHQVGNKERTRRYAPRVPECPGSNRSHN